MSTSAAQLFAPRPAYRFTDIAGNVATNDDPTAGVNPPYGAAINYWLKSAHPDSNALSIAILDATGKTIRTMRGTGKGGLNRVYWNLRNDSSKVARLRTKPLYNAEFQMSRDSATVTAGAPRATNPDSVRTAPGLGRLTVLMPPGSYAVKLTVDGKSYTQPLEVRRDPNNAATAQDIRASTDMLLALQRDLNSTVDLLDRIESVRLQLQRLGGPADVHTAGAALEQKLIAAEQTILDLRMTGRGQDEVRWPVKLGGQIIYLAGGIAASDFTPTAQQREVQQLLANQVRDTRSALDRLIQTDLPAFNTMLSGRGVKTIEVPRADTVR